MGLPVKNFHIDWRVSKPTSAARYSCVHPLRVKAIFAFLMPSADAWSDRFAITMPLNYFTSLPIFIQVIQVIH
ncbi:hypothetical protein [Anabaena subtropica]|uniref:hypothetical protein n=1 Tax=Anabaena subtropica TaxID=425380 RepID=UPI001F55824F|nr:hypothetical protein [Anabaena subtropica]